MPARRTQRCSPFQSTRPLRGATFRRRSSLLICHLFQSTRPLRGATATEIACLVCSTISIHAPLAGRDRIPPDIPHTRRYFNPRAPCGARRVDYAGIGGKQGISIHAPLAGRDRSTLLSPSPTTSFQSTRPLRGATSEITVIEPCYLFQSTRPLRGATAELLADIGAATVFQSTRPLRGATAKAHKKMRHFCAKGINTSSLCAKNAHPAT